MFIGTFTHSVDAKGRLIIPARFRDELGDEAVVTAGLDGCLSIYTKKEWKAFEEKLHALPISSAPARKFTRFFLANACPCEFDKQGRILISQNLRDFAHLEKEVVLTGVGSRIEIWGKDKWLETCTYDDMDEIASALEGLGI